MWKQLAAIAMLAATPYTQSVEQWRRERETRLKADDGWLTVAGLYWLKEGRNSFGSDSGNDLVLPASSAPAHAGAFEFHQGKASVRITAGTEAMLNGKPVEAADLKSDADGSPDALVMRDLTMIVIKRGDRYGMRLRDKNSRMRQEFAGLHWYPVKPAYHVMADWSPYDPVKQIPVLNILGQTEHQPCPGIARFHLDGKDFSLEPVLEDKELFFIFRDLTAGHETYPAGRFLYAELAKDGKVDLDFNKAYNPPCAFTPFATCPLPPKQNHLAIRVEAGELNYHHE